MSRDTLNIHLDILDEPRWNLLEKLIPFLEGFVLGGGTALALQIAHRKSYDFDFFSFSAINKNLLDKLSNITDINNVVIDNPDELTFFTKEEIKLTFLKYAFSPYFEIIKLDNGLNFYSVPEIALHKAYTIGRRGEYRDYFDLYVILKEGYIILNELIKKAKKVYGALFDEKMFLEQLVYFDDLRNFEIVPLAKKIDQPETVKSYFEERVRDYIS